MLALILSACAGGPPPKWLPTSTGVAAKNCHDYSHGSSGRPQDFTLAFEWCDAAAKRGNADAQAALGLLYHYGEGVSADFERSAYWYRLATEQGHVAARARYGWFLLWGIGVPQSFDAGEQLLRESAKVGHEKASTIVRRMEEGEYEQLREQPAVTPSLVHLTGKNPWFDAPTDHPWLGEPGLEVSMLFQCYPNRIDSFNPMLMISSHSSGSNEFAIRLLDEASESVRNAHLDVKVETDVRDGGISGYPAFFMEISYSIRAGANGELRRVSQAWWSVPLGSKTVTVTTAQADPPNAACQAGAKMITRSLRLNPAA